MIRWIGIIGLGLLFFLLLSQKSKAKREVIFTPLAPAPIGPYSQAIKTNDCLYVSGQIALSPKGELDTSSIEAECNQVMNNLKAIIEKAGMKLSNVSKTTIYLTDLKNFSRVNELYQSYFPSAAPARETIEVKALPKGAHLEISMIAEN